MTRTTPSRKLHVLHCIPSLDLTFGGPSQSTASLVSVISEREDIDVTLFYEHGGTEPELNANIKCLHAEMWRRRFWVPSRAAWRGLRSAISMPDVIHLHSYWNAFAALVLREAERLGKPVVLSPRGCLHKDAVDHSSRNLKRVFRALLGSRQLARVDGFHFQSSVEADNSDTGRRSAPPRSIIIDNGVNLVPATNACAAERSRLMGADAPRKNLLFLGRLNRIKGIDLQIEAVGLLRDANIDAVLHLAGPDGGELANLRAHAQALGVADRIRVLGPIYAVEKERWLQAADAVVMSSTFENNSNVALEVLAAGGILVATESSIGPAAAEADAMIRVTRSAHALADGVKAAISDPTTGAEMRLAARRYVARHHDWKSRAARMVEFYRTVQAS